MTDPNLKCLKCGRADFKTKRGLTQHLQSRKACQPLNKNKHFGLDIGEKRMFGLLSTTTITRPKKRLIDGTLAVAYELEDNSGRMPVMNDEDAFWLGSDDDASVDATNADQVAPNLDSPLATIQSNFRKYVEIADHFVDFPKKERDALDLCRRLRQTKASLDTYEDVMEWHLRVNGQVLPHQTIGTHPDFISRKKLFKKLRERYNYDATKWNIVKEITLPHSRARARIVCNDAEAVMQSLLTDPRIRAEDYLFFNDDPFSPPPDDLDYIADLNTGLSYKKTYEKLITDPTKEVLLPVPIYIDGAVTGQFVGLPVTAVQFTLGIFSRVARDRPHMWRTLGYIPSYCGGKSRGKGYFKQSGHADAQMAYQSTSLHDEGDGNNTAVKAQDMHAMLAVILRSFLPLQEKGFLWDLSHNGIVHKDTKFIPFVPYFKCDSEEAEKLAGSYTVRSNFVSQLCRYCECPTAETDNPLADYPLKTVKKIQGLVDRNNGEALRKLSQQNIENATYLLRMGQHSGQGIHGSCPLEMLHALLLGIFGYVRDMLFEQCGPTSQLADEINALATEYGARFARQSERDMPKTKLGGGIRRGKLQAKEHTGILLCILAVLRSTAGQKLLMDQRKGNFAHTGQLEDWILLVETLLEWEEWLKSPRMERKHVVRSKNKHRYIMYLIKKVGKRAKGMGLKLIKYHTILHMSQDILNFGVPMEYDTGSNESGHKKTKQAAKLTQKKEETFDEQVATRLHEEHLLEMAEEEIQGRSLWNYFEGHHHPEKPAPMMAEPRLGGATFEAYVDDTGTNNLRMITRSADEDTVIIESELVDFLMGLKNSVSDFMEKVPLRTTHTRYGNVFRGSPKFFGEVWRDWVMVDWGTNGKLPCKIYGFVDLSELPPNSRVAYGGIRRITPGVYAIVESAAYLNDEKEEKMSELLTPIIKDVGEITNGQVSKQTFYLATVEAFMEPLVVIPDIGGEPNAYFILKSRPKWRELFITWLEASHAHDVMYETEEEDSDED